MLHTNLVKIDQVALEKKMLTDDDGRQPIAIGHLSDAGDLKNLEFPLPKFIYSAKISWI